MKTSNKANKVSNKVNKVNNKKQESAKPATFIEAADALLKVSGKELRAANKEATSLSRVLKDMQRAALMDAGYKAVFEALSLRTDRKFEAREFFEALDTRQCFKDKKGNNCYGIFGWKITRDEAGKEISREQVLRKVTAWSANKVFKMIAQSIALKQEAAK